LRDDKYVFDAGAIVLYFAGDNRVKRYFQEVWSVASKGYISEVNLAEFYYQTARKLGVDATEVRYLTIRNSKIRQVQPNEEITRIAAKLKLKHENILSLADCCAIASAKTLGSKIITTDRTIKDLKEVEAIYFEP